MKIAKRMHGHDTFSCVRGGSAHYMRTGMATIQVEYRCGVYGGEGLVMGTKCDSQVIHM